MKRAGYRDAIDWIARNDSGADDGANDPQIVSELVTACLVAAVFDVESIKVGQDIVRRRVKLGFFQ